MTKLFVGGLSYSVTNDELNSMFAQFGQVVSAMIITDKFSGQSKGFGFVEMNDDSAAQEAIKSLDGSEQNGRKLGVSVAKPKEDRPRSDSGFGGGRPSNGGFSSNRDNNRNFYKKDRR